jgi:alpha-L-fucosidase 2
MKYQVHNNGSYANQIMGYYDYTQDKAYLEEFYPILRGLAVFFMNCIVEHSEEKGYEIGFLVGVHESPVKVRNDGINLAGTIAILRHCARAAKILGKEDEFTARCTEVADALMKTMDSLYNGQFFKASETEDKINMSSITPIYPMGVISAKDPRAISTAESYMGRYVDHLVGFSETNPQSASAWTAGVLGAVLGWQQKGDLVWKVIDAARITMCNFGGMTEVMENGEWNMMYFGTAQGAVCIALHQMLLQTHGNAIDIFPAIPSVWPRASFENLLVNGFTVSASWTPQTVEWTVHNRSAQKLTRDIRYGDKVETVTLQPGEERHMAWPS